MVKINGKDATSDFGAITGVPDNVQDNNEGKEDMEQSNEKAMDIIKRVLPELLERIQKLEAKVNGTGEEEEEKNLSEQDDAATSYLLHQETDEESVDRLLGIGNSRRDVFDDGADQLLGYNKKGRSDG